MRGRSGDSGTILIQDYTEIKSVGETSQRMAGHDLTADSFASTTTLIAVYNLNDNTDFSGNANTLDDADAYGGTTGILNVATSAMLGVNGEHLQADSVSGFSGTGDLDISIGGWHIPLANGGLLAVGTNAATQKVQYYTDAAGQVNYDVAGITRIGSVVSGRLTHIDLVYDQANSMAYGYIDGVMDVTFPVSAALAIQASPSIWVNSKTDGTLEVASEHDEVYVYEGILSQKDIQLLMATKIAEPASLAGKEYTISAKTKYTNISAYEKQLVVESVRKLNSFIFLAPYQFTQDDFVRLEGRL